MPQLVETTGSPVLAVELRKPLNSRKDPGKEVEIFLHSDAPAEMCRALVKENKARKMVSLTIDNYSGIEGSPVPIGPIFWGLFSRKKKPTIIQQTILYPFKTLEYLHLAAEADSCYPPSTYGANKDLPHIENLARLALRPHLKQQPPTPQIPDRVTPAGRISQPGTHWFDVSSTRRIPRRQVAAHQ
jgi:hypothetical protein